MKDLYNKSYEDRIKDIKDNLYVGGGTRQASFLLAALMSPYNITANTDITKNCKRWRYYAY